MQDLRQGARATTPPANDTAPRRTRASPPPPPPVPRVEPPRWLTRPVVPDPDRPSSQTLPIASFAASQLRKAKTACEACCSARAERGGPDHDATTLVKSAKERRADLKELRERKKKQDAEAKAAAANAAATDAATDAAAPKGNAPEAKRDAPTADDAPSSKRRKPSDDGDGGFVAVERFDPTADSDDEGAEREGADPSTGGADAAEGADGADASRRGADDWSEEKKELRRRQVYVGGVPFYKTEEDIVAAFADEGHAVETIDCMTFPDSGRFRGIAIITFATREGAKAALAWNGEEWDGKFLTVKKYAPKSDDANFAGADADADAGAPKPPRPDVEKVEGQRLAFVGNLSWDVTEEALRVALVGCEVKEVRMGVDKETGAFRGYAHVEFVADEDLEQAVSLSGAKLLGREMKVAYATARKAPRTREGREGGGGRGGRSGGRGRGDRRGGGRRAPRAPRGDKTD